MKLPHPTVFFDASIDRPVVDEGKVNLKKSRRLPRKKPKEDVCDMSTEPGTFKDHFPPENVFMKVIRTGEIIPFLDLGIGCAFYAHKRIWVRTNYSVGVVLMGSQWTSGSACDFLIEGTLKSAHSSNGNTLSEPVEVVKLLTEAEKTT